LQPQRLVEPHLLADRLDVGPGRARARGYRCRIRGHDLQQQEANQQHAQQDGHGNHQSVGDMARHLF